MGQTAGTAAALMAKDDLENARDISAKQLRATLKEQGAIIDSLH